MFLLMHYNYAFDVGDRQAGHSVNRRNREKSQFKKKVNQLLFMLFSCRPRVYSEIKQISRSYSFFL